MSVIFAKENSIIPCGSCSLSQFVHKAVSYEEGYFRCCVCLGGKTQKYFCKRCKKNVEDDTIFQNPTKSICCRECFDNFQQKVSNQKNQIH
jgi:hypothetical protein